MNRQYKLSRYHVVGKVVADQNDGGRAKRLVFSARKAEGRVLDEALWVSLREGRLEDIPHDLAATLSREMDVDVIEVTLDGTAEFHDRRRKWKTGQGSFERIFRNVVALALHTHSRNKYAIGDLARGDDPDRRSFRGFHERIRRGGYPCRECAILPFCGASCDKKWDDGEIPCPTMKYNIEKRLLLAYAIGRIEAAAESVADTVTVPC